MTPVVRLRLDVRYPQEQAAKEDLEAKRERRRHRRIGPTSFAPATRRDTSSATAGGCLAAGRTRKCPRRVATHFTL